MKRKLLLLLFAFISLGCFADSQPTDVERRANLFVYNGMLFSRVSPKTQLQAYPLKHIIS